MDTPDVERLLEDLRLHQRELEMQNEILREAQLDLAASRDAFAALFDLVPCGVVVIDLDGVVRAGNATAAQWLHGGEDLAGRHLFSVVEDRDRSQIVERLALARRGSWPPCRIACRSGEQRRILQVEGRACPHLLLPDGSRLACVVLVLTDISASVAEEEALQRARSEAEQAARAKGEFLSLMSHEIRTPLAGIVGIAGVLAEEPLPARAQELLAVLRESADDLHRLLNDLLDMARLEAGRLQIAPALFDLHACLETVAALFAPLAHAKGVELVLDIDPETPRRVVGDEARLRQVISNLVSNAVKFTNSGEVVLAVAPSEEGLEFRVRDSGPGMDEATLARLFQPFVQADAGISRRHGGSGLGLAIARRLVELMHGTIAVDSRPGQGTTMRVTLDLPSDRRSAEQPLAGLAIWLISPQATLRQSLERLCLGWGMQVVAAGDALELHRRIDAEQEAMTALACCIDDRLPDTASERALLTGLGVPLVLLSTAADAEHADLLADHGISAVLSRPVRPSALMACLQRLHRGAARTDPAPRAEPARPWPGLHALVVDDHPVARTVLARLLERCGFTVTTAADGREGVTAACQRWPAVAFIDLQMPVMDGFALARALREHEAAAGMPRIAMIACSAASSDHHRSRALEAGMDGWLPKPASREALAATLQRHLPPGPGAP